MEGGSGQVSNGQWEETCHKHVRLNHIPVYTLYRVFTCVNSVHTGCCKKKDIYIIFCRIEYNINTVILLAFYILIYITHSHYSKEKILNDIKKIWYKSTF